jgi:hypothetical protein
LFLKKTLILVAPQDLKAYMYHLREKEQERKIRVLPEPCSKKEVSEREEASV